MITGTLYYLLVENVLFRLSNGLAVRSTYPYRPPPLG